MTATAPIVVDHDQMLARCATLADTLAARAAEGEALRRLPPATIEDSIEADLFRMVMPTSLGGLGLGLDTLAQSTRLLATGCPSAAWTLSFLVMHSWLLSRFPDAALDEFFTDQPFALAPTPLNPSGTATPVEGGYRLDGRWEWATGVEHAEWVMVHAIVTGDQGFSTRFLVVPRGEVEVDDVWHTSGMRSTGSNTVRVEGVFVPEHRSLDRNVLMESGGARAGDAMAAFPILPVLALVAAAPALGAAEAAVEFFRRRLSERTLAYTLGDKQADQPAARVRLATAIAEVRAARAVWDTALADLATAVADHDPTVEERMAARLAGASTVRMSRQAISTVCEGSGASVYSTSSPLQRWQRDVEVLKGHVVFDWDRCAELAGRIALGIEPTPLDMI